MRSAPRFDLFVAGSAFFLSGTSALIYQVSWQRILALHSGVGLYSIAMIVGAFMAGLGVGSYVAGVFSTRATTRRALLLFALLEVLIAGFGAISATMYYDLLSLAATDLYSVPVRAAVIHFLSLLPPTALMGMSLPFLARAMVSSVATAGRTVGYLYGVNVLGAAVGAVLTPWVLIRLLGVRGSLGVAVGGNLVAATCALVLLSSRGAAAPEQETPPPTESNADGSHPFGLWLVLYCSSGFLALSLEILWFRVLDVAIKSVAFTFGTLLSVYLFGNAVGCLLGVHWVERLRRPLVAFLFCQCALIAYAVGAVVVLASLPAKTPGYAWFYQHWGTVGGIKQLAFTTNPTNALLVYVVLPVLLFGPSTVLMGLSFPILQQAVHNDLSTSGRKVGFLQTANIVGCLLGSLLVGLLLLNWVGTSGGFRFTLVGGICFALLGTREKGLETWFLATALGLGVLFVLMPDPHQLWIRLHGIDRDDTLVNEDASGVSVITMWKEEEEGEKLWRVWVNGQSNSVLPFGGTHTALGAIPALIHPAPQQIAIIGLGSGDTAWAAGCRHDVQQHISVFELIAPQKVTLEQLAANDDPPVHLRSFLKDDRYTHIVADGRNAIERGQAQWDIIEMDAVFPNAYGAGNLYSTDFFAHAASKLKPFGLMCVWDPTNRVFASFHAAFPHVLEFNNRQVLVGSRDPIPVDLDTWSHRINAQAVKSYLGKSQVRRIRERYLASARLASAPTTVEMNHDLYPRDEFSLTLTDP